MKNSLVSKKGEESEHQKENQDQKKNPSLPHTIPSLKEVWNFNCQGSNPNPNLYTASLIAPMDVIPAEQESREKLDSGSSPE